MMVSIEKRRVEDGVDLEKEVRVGSEVFDVVESSGREIVDGDDTVAPGEQRLAEVTPDETAPPCDQHRLRNPVRNGHRGSPVFSTGLDF
jgi:hypothetical protein